MRSQEYREKQRISAQKRMADPARREHLREKIKELWADLAYRQRMIEAHKRFIELHPEERIRLRLFHKGWPKGKPHSAETISKLSHPRPEIRMQGHPNWKAARILGGNGYIYITTFEGRRLEHRVLFEQYLGRRLLQTEVLHHINGNRTDNRIENLCLMTNGKHSSQEMSRIWKERHTTPP